MSEERTVRGPFAGKTVGQRPWYDCTCVQFCDQDPGTACSHSGEWHQHEQEPCPVHPAALMTG